MFLSLDTMKQAQGNNIRPLRALSVRWPMSLLVLYQICTITLFFNKVPLPFQNLCFSYLNKEANTLETPYPETDH